MSTTTYTFKMTEEVLAAKRTIIATTIAQLRDSVHEVIDGSLEHCIIRQNGKLMDELYAILPKGIYKDALVACLKDKFPLDFDRSKESFIFKQAKAKAILEKNKVAFDMPENGEPFAHDAMVELAKICSIQLGMVDWTDYKVSKAGSGSGEKAKPTQEQLDKRAEKLLKDAEDAGLQVALPSKATTHNLTQGYGEYQELFDSLHTALLSADEGQRNVILTLVKSLCEKQMADVVNA